MSPSRAKTLSDLRRAVPDGHRHRVDDEDRSGFAEKTIALLVDLFAYDMDFYNETRAGDRFKLVLEKEYVEGRFLRLLQRFGGERLGEPVLGRGLVLSRCWVRFSIHG